MKSTRGKIRTLVNSEWPPREQRKNKWTITYKVSNFLIEILEMIAPLKQVLTAIGEKEFIRNKIELSEFEIIIK